MLRKLADEIALKSDRPYFVIMYRPTYPVKEGLYIEFKYYAGAIHSGVTPPG